ncbi:hypothetical protein FB45DRAFT_989410 [Roridomyces roridus]|uniref:Cytochrome b561 domain-containing protein n=1 Tax=Roridomyces roridus TaxID=1738132 RepID=A0AAD7FRY7_9AGAR|nr:hypothetical protein FB45DRAFT_989410 [Roridomyces roridus]
MSHGQGGGGGGADAAPEAADGAGDAGGGGNGGGTVQFTFGLNPIEVKARKHALLCAIGFLILLPLGVLLARYARTFTRRWFWGHAIIQLLISGPVIFVGIALGHQLSNELEFNEMHDPHQNIGIALIALYGTQLLLGIFIHFVKLPGLFRGHRPPWNYIHVALGLAILALAAYQVHYGLNTEWPFATGNLHHIPGSAMHAWLALIIIFWVLYFIGMTLLPRQFKAEAAGRERARVLAKETGHTHEGDLPANAA